MNKNLNLIAILYFICGATTVLIGINIVQMLAMKVPLLFLLPIIILFGIFELVLFDFVKFTPFKNTNTQEINFPGASPQTSRKDVCLSSRAGYSPQQTKLRNVCLVCYDASVGELNPKRLKKLESKYTNYISLVNEEYHNFIKTIDENLTELFKLTKKEENDFIITFNDNLNWVSKNTNNSKPDSFIIASCLMFAIIEKQLFFSTSHERSKSMRTFVTMANINIALNCALRLISKPTTYTKINNDCVENKNTQVDIAIPIGIIPNSDLRQRIVETIYNDYLQNRQTSIMQFSNLLHLIYLNCK